MRTMNCDGTSYIVEQGDTLYGISRKFDIPIATLINANRGDDIYNLMVGMELCIPKEAPQSVEDTDNAYGNRGVKTTPITPTLPPETEDNSYVVISYVVKKDDSMKQILERFGLSLGDLEQYNDLEAIILQPGSIVRVPNRRAMDEEKYEQ